MGNVSGIGDVGGLPYTAAVDEKTMCFTSFAIIAFNNDSEPHTLLLK